MEVSNSLRKLKGFSCQICSKSSVVDAGNTTTNCLLHFEVEDNIAIPDKQPTTSIISMELKQPALNALVNTLVVIRDQLSTVASRR